MDAQKLSDNLREREDGWRAQLDALATLKIETIALIRHDLQINHAHIADLIEMQMSQINSLGEEWKAVIYVIFAQAVLLALILWRVW